MNTPKITIVNKRTSKSGLCSGTIQYHLENMYNNFSVAAINDMTLEIKKRFPQVDASQISVKPLNYELVLQFFCFNIPNDILIIAR